MFVWQPFEDLSDLIRGHEENTMVPPSCRKSDKLGRYFTREALGSSGQMRLVREAAIASYLRDRLTNSNKIDGSLQHVYALGNLISDQQ